MARWGLLLQCVAEAVASQGLRGLMGMVPFGQVLYEVGQGVVERYSKKVSNKVKLPNFFDQKNDRRNADIFLKFS